MTSALTHLTCDIALCVPPSLCTFVLAQSKWTKFLVTFFPVFIGSGSLFGMIYVLVMRAIKKNRKCIEVWLEALRLRLQKAPVPIIEKAQPVMLAGLYAIYGRSIWRRLTTSFMVGGFFTLVIFSSVHLRYKHVSANIRKQKAQLEQEVDPILYRYSTDPQLKPELEKSKEQEAMMVLVRDEQSPTKMREVMVLVNKYHGGIYEELRRRTADFQAELVEKLSTNPAKIELTLLFLEEGSYVHPGFRWLDSFFTFLFNIMLDFASVTFAITFLRQLEKKLSFRMAILTFVYTLGSTLTCAATSFLSYRLFFRGNTGVFWQAFVMPLSAGAAIGGIIAAIYFTISFYKKKRKREYTEEDLEGLGIVVSLFGIWCGCAGLSYIWPYWHTISFGFVNWRDLFSFPYILACTTLVPATLSITAFGLMLLTKLTAEPARVLPEAYMTFIKEEVGGSQAAGIIALLGMVTGVLAGFIWPGS